MHHARLVRPRAGGVRPAGNQDRSWPARQAAWRSAGLGRAGVGSIQRRGRHGGGDAQQSSETFHCTLASLTCPALTMRMVSDFAMVAPDEPPRSA